jgi:SWI/SNF-related matrix-associated actin-dependent regulator 1 of chromatin subfamily A
VLIPRPYQIVGRDFLASRRHALLADEMRVGKTPQAILAAVKAGARKILVATQSIATRQWVGEWERWGGLPAARLSPGVSVAPITVTSYDTGLLRHQGLLAETWDVVIPDECHFAGNLTAKRTALIYGKNLGVGWTAGAIWPLSGTPAPKTAASLWPMMRAFGKVKMEYVDFIREFCTLDADGKPIGTKEHRIPELRAILDTFMLRRLFKDVAPEVPEIAFNFLAVEPDGKTDLASLGNLTDEQIEAELEKQSEVDREDRVAVALAKVGPLSDEIEHVLGNCLLKQTVVFGWHLDALRKMVSVLRARGFRAELLAGPTSGDDRERIKREFKEGTIDVVAAQIRAAGTAIDLSAARHGYFLELDWIPGNNRQAAFRMMNVELKTPVSMDIVTWPGSIDDRIQRILLRRVRELSKLY